ncbi:hypothetical protein UPYG_G00303930 [Umbra pygmaea]|uniref:G-protein coupled receptors family 1 profile domain-containing protein n=1 Tax=Umbra pygmaea TaxID=75934 RepID=A0ABD0WWN3_UMBPY
MAPNDSWGPLGNDYEEYYDGGLVWLCDDVGGLEHVSAAFFLLIFVLSVSGNGLVLIVLCSYEDLYRVTNVFIIHLLASDLLFTLTLPFWAVYNLSHWMFGDLGCKLLTWAYFTGVYTSLMLLTCMTVYRFVTVVIYRNTTLPQRRLIYAWAACIASWVTGCAASIRDGISSIAQEVGNGTGISTCEALLVTTEEKSLGYYLQVSLLFLLPLIIIILCYSAILRTILVSAIRIRYCTVLILFCIVVSFFICWAPYNLIIFLEAILELDCKDRQTFYVAYSVCRIVAYGHCCVNPALYMMQQSWRRHFCSLLHCWAGERGQRGTRGGRSMSTITRHPSVNAEVNV